MRYYSSIPILLFQYYKGRNWNSKRGEEICSEKDRFLASILTPKLCITLSPSITGHCTRINPHTLPLAHSESESHVHLFLTPWTVAPRAPQSMEFSRQEYWSGLPFPSPADLSDPGIESGSPALQADSLPSEPPGTPLSSPTLHLFPAPSLFHGIPELACLCFILGWVLR